MAEETNPIEKALKRRDEADYQAFLKLRELMKMTDYDPGRQKLLKIIAEYNGYDIEDAEEFIKEIEAVLEERDDATDEFLQAVKDHAAQAQKS